MESGTLTIFLYDGLDVIYEETYSAPGDPLAALTCALLDLGSPTSTADYVHANGQLVAKIVPAPAGDPSGRLGGEVATYYHPDHLGSTRVLTDSLGTPVARMDYEPFGAFLGGSFGGERYAYTGQHHEPPTALYYYGARFHDPALGRFITQDPAQDGLNWYAYCENNPLAHVDPDGRSSTAAVAETMAWAPFVDGPILPIGDMLYGAAVGATALGEYGPVLLDKVPAAATEAWNRIVNLFSQNRQAKNEVDGLVRKPLTEHLDKLAGRAPKNMGNPNDPYNRNKWTNDLKRAWDNIVKELKKLDKPLGQVLKELGWNKEAIDKVINDMKDSGVKLRDFEKWVGGGK